MLFPCAPHYIKWAANKDQLQFNSKTNVPLASSPTPLSNADPKPWTYDFIGFGIDSEKNNFMPTGKKENTILLITLPIITLKTSHQSKTYICTKNMQKYKIQNTKCSNKNTATILQGCVQIYYSKRQSKPITSRYKQYVLRKKYGYIDFKLTLPKSRGLNLVIVDPVNIINLRKVLYLK